MGRLQEMITAEELRADNKGQASTGLPGKRDDCALHLMYAHVVI